CRLANWSAPTPIQSGPAGRPPARRNPQPSTAIPAASLPRHPRARPTPHPGPSLPAAPRITPSHPANWSIPFASTHATRRGHRTPACLALAVSAGRDSWGTPTGPPRPGDRLARPTGQRPLDAHKGPDGLLALTPFEPSQRDLIPDPSLPSSAKSNGQLAYEVGRREGGRDPGSWPGVPSQSPLQPPGAAGPVSGGGV
ncbi:hypothetical protein BO83DRAFT_444188, partial [Aspergillus eucalypticola CBS 122712]